MRTIIMCAAVLLLFGAPEAQVRVGVNINIGRQPVWVRLGMIMLNIIIYLT